MNALRSAPAKLVAALAALALLGAALAAALARRSLSAPTSCHPNWHRPAGGLRDRASYYLLIADRTPEEARECCGTPGSAL
jgi:hypothetical protein